MEYENIHESIMMGQSCSFVKTKHTSFRYLAKNAWMMQRRQLISPVDVRMKK